MCAERSTRDRSVLYERVPQAYRDDPAQFAAYLLPIERECLDRWLAGETNAAIGADLGVSGGRVQQRRDRAVRRIKGRLGSAPGKAGGKLAAWRREQRIAWQIKNSPAARIKAGVLMVIETYDPVALVAELSAWDLENVWEY